MENAHRVPQTWSLFDWATKLCINTSHGWIFVSWGSLGQVYILNQRRDDSFRMMLMPTEPKHLTVAVPIFGTYPVYQPGRN